MLTRPLWQCGQAQVLTQQSPLLELNFDGGASDVSGTTTIRYAMPGQLTDMLLACSPILTHASFIMQASGLGITGARCARPGAADVLSMGVRFDLAGDSPSKWYLPTGQALVHLEYGP